MLDLIGKSDNFRRPFQVLAKEGRQDIAPAGRPDRCRGGSPPSSVLSALNRKCGLTWACRELDFGLRQQRLLPLVLSGEDLRRQQLGNPPPPRVRLIELNRRFFRLIQFNGSYHPLVLAAQGDHQRRPQLTVRMNRAAVRHLVAVGVDHPPRSQSPVAYTRRK